MYVKIGSYPGRLLCRIHGKYMDTKYGCDWPAEVEWTRTGRFIEQLENVIQSVYNVINRVYFDRLSQKVKVRIDRQDIWSMDSTLAYIIVPMLKQLKEDKHGAPYVEYTDVPKHLRPSKKEVAALKGGSTDEHWFKRWDWILDEMIIAFESCNNDWEEQFVSGNMDHITVPIDIHGNEVPEKEAKLFRWDKGSNHTYKIDKEGRNNYQARIQNGFRLFGKYYQSLWS